MIEYIKGQLTYLAPTYAVIEAAGVGYEINIPLTAYSTLAGREKQETTLREEQEPKLREGQENKLKARQEPKLRAGQETKLFVTEIIREDTHDLFGFLTQGERALFLLLMTVSGIGANTARMIMSAYSASEVRTIIATGNAHALAQVKGLGPKTAQRVIVDLKDKVLKIDLGTDDAAASGANEISTAPVDSEVKTEAVSALTMLGFPAAASSKVVDKILSSNASATVEQVIKQALKML